MRLGSGLSSCLKGKRQDLTPFTNRMMLEKNSPVRTLVGSLKAFNQLASGKIANLRILHYVSLTLIAPDCWSYGVAETIRCA